MKIRRNRNLLPEWYFIILFLNRWGGHGFPKPPLDTEYLRFKIGSPTFIGEREVAYHSSSIPSVSRSRSGAAISVSLKKTDSRRFRNPILCPSLIRNLLSFEPMKTRKRTCSGAEVGVTLYRYTATNSTAVDGVLSLFAAVRRPLSLTPPPAIWSWSCYFFTDCFFTVLFLSGFYLACYPCWYSDLPFTSITSSCWEKNLDRIEKYSECPSTRGP